MSRARAVVLVALVLVELDGAARAETCAAPAGGSASLVSIDSAVRLRFLRERLRAETRRVRIWSWAWAGAYSALTVGSLALLADGDANKRPDHIVTAAASLIGLGSKVVTPQPILHDQAWFERRIARAPAGESQCALVAEGERLLAHAAHGEAFGTGTLLHLGTFLVNVAGGLTLGIAFDHWGSAALQGVGGIAIGELMIFTQPEGAERDLERYRAGNLGLPPASHPLTSWRVVPTANGLAVAGEW